MDAGLAQIRRTLTLDRNRERRLIQTAHPNDHDKQARAARRTTVAVPLLTLEAILEALSAKESSHD